MVQDRCAHTQDAFTFNAVRGSKFEAAARTDRWPWRMGSKLVPELYCRELSRSLQFYIEVVGFEVLFARMEESFVYLQRDGAELMLEEPGGEFSWQRLWNTRTAAE